jgi:hypothetical protein
MLAMAKEQHGCRYLQRVIADESPKGLQPLLAEILPEVGGLMMDPFGNYLVQKVLEICSSEQRSALLNQACETTGLMSIACNMHGTRALQKLVETVRSTFSFHPVFTVFSGDTLDVFRCRDPPKRCLPTMPRLADPLLSKVRVDSLQQALVPFVWPGLSLEKLGCVQSWLPQTPDVVVFDCVCPRGAKQLLPVLSQQAW